MIILHHSLESANFLVINVIKGTCNAFIQRSFGSRCRFRNRDVGLQQIRCREGVIMHMHLKEILVLAAGFIVGQVIYTKLMVPTVTTTAA